MKKSSNKDKNINCPDDGIIEPPKGKSLVYISDEDRIKNLIDDLDDKRNNAIAAKAQKAADFWKTEEAKEKPWLTKVPPYVMGFDTGDNFENFVDDRIKELLSEIDYKTWESKDRTFCYEWTFDGFQVYQECSRSLQSYTIDLFEEQDTEIRNLILECICLYKQIWHARHTSHLATHGEYEDTEHYHTMCKVGVGRELFDVHRYTSGNISGPVLDDKDFKRLMDVLKKHIN